MGVHSPVGLIPTCAAVLSAALLPGCRDYDPYADMPMRPKGYWGTTQLVEEQATGCLYSINTRAKTQERPVPWLRPDGSHMGCRATTANSVGILRQQNESQTPVHNPERARG